MELRPCPFCGGEAEIRYIRYSMYEHDRMAVQCNECGAYMEANVNSQEAIAAKWNQRTTPERKKAYWVYVGTGYKDHVGCCDIESFICGGCYVQRERVNRRWGRDLTPPQKPFCSNCGAEMDTAKYITRDEYMRRGGTI